MKRKIFSKLLMVALVIAAVGSFVSCKDYDDDINNLQKQIDNAALKSSVEALQSSLESKITAAQNAAAAAQTAADKAAATANAAVTKAQLDEAISAAKSAAATAANEYADKVAAAAQTAAAQKAYDDAKAYVDAEVAKVTAAIPSEDAIKAIAAAAAAELDEALATELKTWVNEQIDAIDVQGQVEAAVADAIAKIDTATANVNAIWSAITSIEIYPQLNHWGGAHAAGVADGGTGVDNVWLSFVNGTKIASVFGDEHSLMKETVTYTEGEKIELTNRLIVRVNPVNATLTADMIKLIDSQGNSLDELVNIGTPTRYTGILTRAGVETGLWVVPLSRKTSATDAQFKTATSGSATTGLRAYALAVNNTSAAAADRYVTSSFDIAVQYGPYAPAWTLDFNVGNTNVYNLHNRWYDVDKKVIAEDETKEDGPADYMWNWDPDNFVAPAADMTGVDKKKLIQDSRYLTTKYAAVKKGETLTLSGFDNTEIEYYYVVLDSETAIESNPSELQAWLSYNIGGLNKMTPSTDNLILDFSDEDADGDIIGFRVFGVNYDGTLADPDGVAFYVQVGTPKAEPSATASVTFTAYVEGATYTAANYSDEVTDGTGLFNIGYVAFNPKDAGFKMGAQNVKFDDEFTLSGDNGQNAFGVVYPGTTVKGRWMMLKNDKKTVATSLADVRYIGIIVDNPGFFWDNGSVTISMNTGTDPDHHDKATNKLSIAISKTLPTKAIEFAWKSTYEPVDGVKTFYPVPDETIANQWYTDAAVTTPWDKWSTDVSAGSLSSSMKNFATFTANAEKYDWKFFTNSSKEKEADKVSYNKATQVLTVNASRIGSNSKTIYGEYGIVYDKVKCTKDKYGQFADGLKEQNHKVNAFAGNVVFEDVLSKFSFAAKSYEYYTMKVSDKYTTKTSTKYAVLYPLTGTTALPRKYNLGYEKNSETAITWDGAKVDNIANMVTCTNSVISKLTGNFDVTNYISFDGGSVKNSAGNEGLITVFALDFATGKISFSKIEGSSAPLEEVTETVSLKLTDAFGRNVTASFPITILPEAKTTGFME